MGSEGCIYPSCGCKAYRDPGHPKGTLLLMRLGCKGCGHHGSQHRRLTAVDQMVREEVEKVGAVRCSHLIPLNEIPHSPLFRPHDPIPIPYDSDHDQADGVRCTCPGFQVTSLVKLWQSFRSYSLSTTLSLLPTITCSHCGHTLQEHQPRPGGAPGDVATPTNIGSGRGEMDVLEQLSGVCNPQLTLKASTKLALAPFRSCVQVLPADEKEENGGTLTIVSLHSPSEGEIHVLVSNVELVLGDGQKQPQEEEEGVLRQTSTNSTHLNGSTGKCFDVTETDTTSNCPEKSSKSEEGGKGRKRRRRVSNSIPPTRKSARLQGRAGREREGEEKEQQVAAEVKRREEEMERWRERVRGEGRAVCGRVVEWVSSLEDRTSFAHYPLPQAISVSGVEMMGVARAGGGGLVLGLGTTSGQVFLVSIIADNLLWLPLEVADTSGKRRVKCLSWLVNRPGQLYLATGYSGGLVAVWRIDLNQPDSQAEHSVVGRLQDTRADITLTSWAPDKRVLAVGTVMGEVVLYVSGPDSSSGWQCSQKLGCGGSAITCAAWMTNSSILAVGGTDDSIHILQRRQSPTTSRPTNTQSSLFSYFKPVDADKFVYTHWLRGHCSFVSSLLPLGSSTLLSIGWDCHMLFWQEIGPIRFTNGEVFPIEDSQPQSGFKLGPSTTTEYLPLSVCEVAGFGVLVLFTNANRDVDISYYTFLPTETS